MRRWFVIVVALVSMLAGCQGKQEGAPPGPTPAGPTPAAPPRSKGTIGLSVLTLTNPFFKVIADSMTEEANKSGYGVEVVSGEFDVAIP